MDGRLLASTDIRIILGSFFRYFMTGISIFYDGLRASDVANFRGSLYGRFCGVMRCCKCRKVDSFTCNMNL